MDCRVASKFLNQRCLQKGWTNGIGGTIHYDHVLKLLNAKLVAIRAMIPSKDWIVRDAKFECHRVVLPMQDPKQIGRMGQDAASCGPRLWEVV